MAKDSETRGLLFEIIDRCFLFASEGSAGPYAAAMGREEYEAMLTAKKRKRAREAIQRLKKQKLLRIREEGEEFIVSLTKKGRIEAVRYWILTKKDLLPNRKVCLVSFDFPEDIRGARHVWRDFLKLAKFKQAHQSVWVSRRDVVNEVRLLVGFLNAEHWVKVFEASENK
jgi:DNA-binding transcriptional regulator PaaX